jgi:tungstate transport system substrate-binding protein
MSKRLVIVIVAAIAIVASALIYSSNYFFKQEKLVIATTTSLYDTGLLDILAEEFEKDYGIKVSFISVGTGLAIEHGKRGDVDMIIVHAPRLEFRFLQDGFGVNRKIIAYNFFVIAGPKDDPANIKGMNLNDGLKMLVKEGRKNPDKVKWVSRGDKSGTHMKEIYLWRLAGFDADSIKKEKWYLESGTGMGKTLIIANEKDAYTLTDVGTYLKYKKDELIQLETIIGKSKELLNVYSAIIVNPNKHEINFENAKKFIKFLLSEKGQKIIEEFKKDEYGVNLFNSISKLVEKGEEGRRIISWIKELATLNGEECPKEYRYKADDLYL